TFLDFYGGEDTTTQWVVSAGVYNHWSDAVNWNIGQPGGSYSQETAVVDYTNPTTGYEAKVYERTFSGRQRGHPVLLLYQPLSYNPSNHGSGTVGGDATTVPLPSGVTYHKLK